MNLDHLVQKLKKDALYIFLAYIITLAIFKIGFYNEPLLSLARICLSFYWLFVIPGFFIIYTFPNDLDFLSRFFVGTALGAAVIGISSYYAGLLGLHIRYHGIILPLAAMIISSAAIILRQKLVRAAQH